MIDFANADPDAYIELWQPQVGQQVRILVPTECRHICHQWQGIALGTEFVGTVRYVADDPTTPLKRVLTFRDSALGKPLPPTVEVLDEWPQLGHRFMVQWRDDGRRWHSGVFAAAELEPL